MRYFIDFIFKFNYEYLISHCLRRINSTLEVNSPGNRVIEELGHLRDTIGSLALV